MLKAGYTATHDEHFTNIRRDSADGSWAAVADSRMRGFLCRCIVNAERIPESGRETVEAGLAEAERLRGGFASHRIEVAAGFLYFLFLQGPDTQIGRASSSISYCHALCSSVAASSL